MKARGGWIRGDVPEPGRMEKEEEEVGLALPGAGSLH